MGSNEMSGEPSGENGFSITDELLKDYNTLFNDKSLIKPDTIVDEDRIVGRNAQLNKVIQNYRPLLHGEPVEDLLFRGPSGTGKSLIAETVSQKVRDLGKQHGIEVHISIVNCKHKNTEFNTLCEIVSRLESEYGYSETPTNGVSTASKYDRMFEIIGDEVDVSIFVFDELDLLDGNSNKDTPDFSDLLYKLSRPKELYDASGEISILATTNSPQSLMDRLNSRTHSTFNPTEVVFDDYTAMEIIDILEHRSDAFKPGVLDGGVIEYVSALAANAEGDARFAIDLLREAGNIANRRGDESVQENHVDKARKEVEKNYTLDFVKSISQHKRRCVYAIALMFEYASDEMDRNDVYPNGLPTGTAIYRVYEYLCDNVGSDSRSKSIFYRWLGELETYDMISQNRLGKGFKSGVSSEVLLTNASPESIIKAIDESEGVRSDLEEEIAPQIRNIVKNI